MRETIQQLEAEARAAELIRKQKEQYPYKFTADSLSCFVILPIDLLKFFNNNDGGRA